MKVYSILRTQTLPITLDQAWAFFSNPQNLGRITPAYMKFKILHQSGGEKAYAGQLIKYRINVLPLLPVIWLTEITHVKEKEYFVDEQRQGPYSLWHHQHRFAEVNGMVEMTDEVNYAIPLGPLGRLANLLFVQQSVNAIFDYRFQALENIFSINSKR